MENYDPNIGSYFGNYRLLALIACGSYGCVYKAQHLYLPRLAAIKLLHFAHLRSSRTRAKFLQEAVLLESLHHPHILSIYDFGIQDGFPYLVTPYAAGGSLRNLLKKHAPLSTKEAKSILAQVGTATHYIHKQNLVHRDLKPENILFTSEGKALVADFGIASIMSSVEAKSTPMFAGTPAYMAPEQFRGQADEKSDQYALGCIAYELFTGRAPFKAPNAIAMENQHSHLLPILPTRLNPAIPLYIEHAILKAMEKRRINRYPDVQSFIQAICY